MTRPSYDAVMVSSAPVSPIERPRPPSVGGLVASGVLLAALAFGAVVGVRRAFTISLPADWACAVACVGLLGWVGLDLQRRFRPLPRHPAGRLRRMFTLRPGVLAWAHSCHKADVACGNCRGCNKYFEVLRELGHGMDRAG